MPNFTSRLRYDIPHCQNIQVHQDYEDPIGLTERNLPYVQQGCVSLSVNIIFKIIIPNFALRGSLSWK